MSVGNLGDRRDAFEQMRDAAAEHYRAETGDVWRPRRGSHTSHTSQTGALTSAAIDVRDFQRARKDRETRAHLPEGRFAVDVGASVHPDPAPAAADDGTRADRLLWRLRHTDEAVEAAERLLAEPKGHDIHLQGSARHGLRSALSGAREALREDDRHMAEALVPERKGDNPRRREERIAHLLDDPETLHELHRRQIVRREARKAARRRRKGQYQVRNMRMQRDLERKTSITDRPPSAFGVLPTAASSSKTATALRKGRAPNEQRRPELDRELHLGHRRRRAARPLRAR